MEEKTRAAIYARVSTDRQEQEQTIQSQLAALRAYAEGKGYEAVREYVDDGLSGTTLARPGLDALRDALPSGDFSAVLFHSPDRMARKALYQGILLEEIERAGVKAEFLNYAVDDTPESKMLLGMQGLFSEYEHAKIAERTRRGKLHWANEGVLVGGLKPYGYRFVKRTDRERAHLEPDEYQAGVVRSMFRWLVEEQLSTRAVACRLTDQGVPTARGAKRWSQMVVDRIFRSTVYRGVLHYHRVVYGTANDPQRPRAGTRERPPEEWIEIPVPALVEEGLWYAAQRQLDKNSHHSRRNNKKHEYLLRGLIQCPRCGGAYIGAAKESRRTYRCGNVDAARSSKGTICKPGSFSADLVEGEHGRRHGGAPVI